jgi:D-alanyl-D-alanine dipeptidase
MMDGAGAVVLLSDPRIGAIGVAASGEPLVRLRGTDRLSIADRPPQPPIGLRPTSVTEDYAHVRRGLADRLVAAAETLPEGLRLHVVEGYRTTALQQAYFEAYRQQLLAQVPTLTAEESHRLASRFVAPLDVAAHTSGAAVDVTIVDEHGRELDMGTPIDATPEDSRGACYFGAPGLSSGSRTNRDLLGDCLVRAGLVNYPTEWWHWSFGDRYWAFSTGSEAALYGPVEPGDA